MMTILNRLRGSDGLWAKIIGLLLGLIVCIAFDNIGVTLTIMFGYIIGESFGWGLWVGSLTDRADGYTLYLNGEREGANNGIHWMASHIIKPTQESWINYCRVALAIRGLYWWTIPLSVLYFVGLPPYFIAGALLFLSISFPLACEIGYILDGKIKFHKYGLSVEGGWEIQEVVYGFMQDLVLIGIVLWLM